MPVSRSVQSTPSDPAGQDLLIVARDHGALCQALQEVFAGRGSITVVVDRRQAARRRCVQPVREERRSRERRSVPAAAYDLRCQDYVLVRPSSQ